MLYKFRALETEFSELVVIVAMYRPITFRIVVNSETLVVDVKSLFHFRCPPPSRSPEPFQVGYPHAAQSSLRPLLRCAIIPYRHTSINLL